MTWKKTWFSKILWVCQFVITALFLTGTCGIFLDKYKIAEKYSILPGYNRLIWLGVICALFFVVSLLVFLIIRLIVGRLGNVQVKKSAKISAEILVFATLFAGGLLYRLNLFPETVERNAYYELAMVTDTQMPAPLAHGALYMYILLLHTLFLVVGNNLMAGIILQMVLQYIAIGLIYSAVRRIAGVIPAICTFAAFMFAPTWVNAGLSYTPESLYLVLGGIILWILSSVLKIVKNTERYRWYHYTVLFLFGICLAFMIYLDALATAFLVACVFVFGISKTETETKNNAMSLSLFLIIVLGAVTGFLGIFALDAWQSGANLASIAGVWQWLYVPETGTPFSYLYHQLFLRLSDNLPFAVVIFVGMTWSIFAFFLDKKKEGQGIWILMLLSGIALSYVCPASGNMDRSFIGLLGMMILAGKGVQMLLTRKNQDTEMQAEDMFEESQVEETPVEEAPIEQVPVKEIKYIENPLPLPKKHVKKTMDYAIDISEEQLEFDIEISEDDDFDF